MPNAQRTMLPQIDHNKQRALDTICQNPILPETSSGSATKNKTLPDTSPSRADFTGCFIGNKNLILPEILLPRTRPHWKPHYQEPNYTGRLY
ncbi:hypothetical protein MMC07_002366 [Pseudocyphellaria aurata]|nr:hypothetical protein [Pseudocyphellaria aurata]